MGRQQNNHFLIMFTISWHFLKPQAGFLYFLYTSSIYYYFPSQCESQEGVTIGVKEATSLDQVFLDCWTADY